MCWKLFCFCCDKLEIKINNLLDEHMFVCRVSGFKYCDKGSELAKSLFKSVDCIGLFDLQIDYRIGKACLGGCWLGSTLWDEGTKMRKALINKLDIIIFLDYLKEWKCIEMYHSLFSFNNLNKLIIKWV